MPKTERSNRGALLELIAADPDAVFRPEDVAVLWRVDSKSVSRWHATGKLTASFLTPGGQRRWVARDLAPHFGITYAAGGGS